LIGWSLGKKELSGSSTLPTTTIGVVGTSQMVFTNLIMTTRVNRIVDQPPMSSMAIKRYKSANAMNLRRGYRKPYVVSAPILDLRDGHYVRPNKVALKYLDFKKI